MREAKREGKGGRGRRDREGRKEEEREEEWEGRREGKGPGVKPPPRAPVPPPTARTGASQPSLLLASGDAGKGGSKGCFESCARTRRKFLVPK